MPAFLTLLRDILLLRRGPQDLPHSPQLLASVAAAGVVVQSAAAAVMTQASVAMIVLSAVFSVVLTLFAVNVLLSLRGLRNRFVQTATAMIGCNVLFTALGIPAALFMPVKPTSPEQMPAIALLLAPLLFAFIVWQIAVNAHILRHSLDIPFWAGVGMVLAWVFAVALLAGLAGAPAVL